MEILKIVRKLESVSEEYIGTLLDKEFVEAIRAAADLLVKQGEKIVDLEEQNRWIPVTERLPENREDVLVVAFWHEKWNVLLGWHAPNGEVWHVGPLEKTDCPVSHWMPLPELPKEVC